MFYIGSGLRCAESLSGYELEKNSSKAKTTVKVVLLNLYSTATSDPDIYLRYSRKVIIQLIKIIKSIC
jgi:hypothetical protein